ncbi:MAG: hypothetical protein COU90_01180 [Candidatus Ryanbacteria bacterium CG10_big_fil_rev_8_21_14_0_10_43_42]|uniref:Glycerophosphoryl diester phosphodiesterase membrane domain-containing protein n=1 Tax=Candidatus Ryanbacteria bacterium CG10_big_fil_rev_8_21_14_0_10_43_42 TaxID=1974864 RepID=A0A2M8KY59_9BACT|nr:MAG: hypothetical protein COU90_01180 [Candidatus Ryanbacteria bacterium CG10_big_fil_rev_8_21_14_0_10_43_42]
MKASIDDRKTKESDKATKDIVHSCISLLNKERKLLVFPMLSFALLVTTLLLFGVYIDEIQELFDYLTNRDVSISIPILIGLFIIFFIESFFQAALITSTHVAIKGKRISIGYGITKAFNKIANILLWSIISTLMNFVDRLYGKSFVGKIFGQITLFAWRILTLFSLPILILTNADMVTAIKQSASVLKSSFGENIVGNIKIWLFLLPYVFLSVIALVIGFRSEGIFTSGIFLGGGIISLLFLFVLGRTLGSVFRTVLFVYVDEGKIAHGFLKASLDKSFKTKGEKNI